MPEFLSKPISDFRDPLIAGMLVALVLFAIGFMFLLSRLGKLNRQYARLTRNTSGGNLEEILHGYMDAVNGIVARVDGLEKRAAELEEAQRGCLQRVGVVRFDAFEEVGGEQSFAVVMLDEERNGVSFSSVYSRNDVRVYAKAIKNGSATFKLTAQEQKAMAEANGK